MSKYDDYELIHFSSVRLPYKYSALEPYIDEETMQIHYNKHYLGYLKKYQILTDDENTEYKEEYGDSFQSMIGAEAIQKLLSEIDLEVEQKIVRADLESTNSETKNN